MEFESYVWYKMFVISVWLSCTFVCFYWVSSMSPNFFFFVFFFFFFNKYEQLTQDQSTKQFMRHQKTKHPLSQGPGNTANFNSFNFFFFISFFYCFQHRYFRYKTIVPYIFRHKKCKSICELYKSNTRNKMKWRKRRTTLPQQSREEIFIMEVNAGITIMHI